MQMFAVFQYPFIQNAFLAGSLVAIIQAFWVTFWLRVGSRLPAMPFPTSVLPGRPVRSCWAFPR